MPSQTHARGDAPAVATRALLAAAGLYLGYAGLARVGLHPELQDLLLVAAFYFVPQAMLAGDEVRQAAYQVGPGGVVPGWSWRGARIAGIAVLGVFPPFVLGFLWFYQHVCAGDFTVLRPVLAVESLTPARGGLEAYLCELCRAHNGSYWPTSIVLPPRWLEWWGAGLVLTVAIEVFAIALPEEVFHRGYLMSALEERWAPRTRVLGVPFGAAAVGASVVFAVGHLVGLAEVARLATFFPALAFSWLWRKSGTLWAPALFHTASNLLMAVLLASTFPR